MFYEVSHEKVSRLDFIYLVHLHALLSDPKI